MIHPIFRTILVGIPLFTMLCLRSCSAAEIGTRSVLYADTVFHPSVILSPYLPEHITFAGEEVPINRFDVFESLERELIVNAYLHSNTIQCIKRAARYFPVIEPILAAHHIPDDFKYLCVIESDLMNKVSPAGATGFWQLLKTTATEYGLEVNAEVDERYHLEKSTVAACQYLQSSYEIYGNWTMAAASYNMGKAGTTKQIARQRVDNYYDLLLNDETARYVFRILALKSILEQPEQYGFFIREEEKYAPIEYKEVTVDKPISDWVDFAYSHHINYKLLKIFNPWLRDTFLTNKNKKTYVIKIPITHFRKELSEELSDKEIEQIEAQSQDAE